MLRQRGKTFFILKYIVKFPSVGAVAASHSLSPGGGLCSQFLNMALRARAWRPNQALTFPKQVTEKHHLILRVTGGTAPKP